MNEQTKDQKQDRQNSRDKNKNKNRPQPPEKNEGTEDKVHHPFDPDWLDRLPKQDDQAYRPWWVVEDPWSDPWPEPSGPRS